MSFRSLSFLLLLSVFSFLPSSSQAQVNPQRLNIPDDITGFTANTNLTVSYNLLGLQAVGDVGYRWRLYGSESRAFRENFVLLSGTISATPAWLEAGAFVAVQPASFFNFKAMYRFRFQIPTFFSGAVFADVAETKSIFENQANPILGHRDGEDRLRAQIQKAADANGGARVLPMSHIFSVDTTLRFEISGIVALLFARYEYWLSDYAGSDRYKAFYEGGMDMFVTNREHLLSITGLLGYRWRMLLFAAMTSYRNAFEAQSVNFRLGPTVRWQLAERWGPFLTPNLLFVVHWYLQHQWRAVDYVPLFAVQFGGNF